MKRLSSLFPLIIVALLAGASFWLEYVVRNETREGLGKDRHDPDAIVHNFKVERFDKTGTLNSRLLANKLTHYPDNDTAEVEAPRISFMRNDQVTTFRSEHALADDRQHILTMIGKVQGERPAKGQQLAQTLATDELMVWTDDEIARTQHPIIFTQGKSKLEAIGAEWNNISGQLQLNKHVQAILPGRPAQPATP